MINPTNSASTHLSTTIPAHGPTPNNILFIGEAPGYDEYLQQRPFCGRTGQYQQSLLNRHGTSSNYFRLTNLINTYKHGNPDPTPADIATHTPRLISEIQQTQPKLIVAVGRFATKWLLGNDADLNIVHGLPQVPGAFDYDPAIARRACGAVVVPVFHPASGFYDDSMNTLVHWDYKQLAGYIQRVTSGKSVTPITDQYLGEEKYEDITGTELSLQLSLNPPSVVALDTEGFPHKPWSIQVSTKPGTAYVLRVTQPDFHHGISALQQLADDGCLFITHDASTPQGCLYDVIMCRAMGLDLSRAKLWNTMYAPYLLRIEPQALKSLSWRWCGMKMEDYESIVDPVEIAKRIEYLSLVSIGDWPKPGPQEEPQNDGTIKIVKRPWSIQRRAAGILKDIENGNITKSKKILERWDEGKLVRQPAIDDYGPLPSADFDDIDLETAIYYAGRDADATYRVYKQLKPQLAALDLTRTMDQGMKVAPVFEQLQRTGMPASRSAFEALTADVRSKMDDLQKEISTKYFNNLPFNPGSSPQVAELLKLRGLKATKTTKKGAVSTAKTSIEHLRFEDPALTLVFDWREHLKVISTYCLPTLDRLSTTTDISYINCVFKISRTTSRRLAMENPNLQQIPIRHGLGMKVRNCYQAPEGLVFGAWDLSQVEMRYAAHLSNDPLLCRLFKEGRDVHSETAARIFNIDIEDVDSMLHRYPAKRAGFGTLYGVQGKGLLTQLQMMGCEDWTEKKCEQLINNWLSVYSGVHKSIKQTEKELRTYGYVRDAWGMYRYEPGIWGDKYAQAKAVREAFNHKIQGGAQGMIQNSMIWLWDKILDLQADGWNVRGCLQIHDELIFLFDECLWPVMDELVVEALTCHHGVEDMRVPVLAEGHQAKTWGGLK